MYSALLATMLLTAQSAPHQMPYAPAYGGGCTGGSLGLQLQLGGYSGLPQYFGGMPQTYGGGYPFGGIPASYSTGWGGYYPMGMGYPIQALSYYPSYPGPSTFGGQCGLGYGMAHGSGPPAYYGQSYACPSGMCPR